MTVRNVKKNLAGQQDLLPGLGPYKQIRRGQTVIVDGPAKSYFDLFVRSYAEAGLPVKGTFEDGCTLDTVDDIAIHLAEGKGYSYSGTLPHTIGAGETPVGNPLWISREHILKHDASKTYTIGVGGNYVSLNEAITALSKIDGPFYKKEGVIIELRLLSGFVMREQVLLDGGIDLGWIRITAEDVLTTIDETYITVPISLKDVIYPIFGAINNSTLPVIGCKFQYLNNLTAKDGVSVMVGSKVILLPDAGVVRARKGLTVFYGSEAACYPLGLTQGGDGVGAGTATGVDFSYASGRGLHVAYGSRASLGRSNFSHCDGDVAVYVIWNSIVDCYQSNASYCVNGYAFHARDGSTLNCRESNASHSRRGFHALHNGRINARSRLSGPTMIWIGDGAQFCTEYGVLASSNSHIDASELNAGNCTGNAAISASDSSNINFSMGSAKNCTARGVYSQSGSSISAIYADVSGCGTGLEAICSATIAANFVVANDCTGIGALATQGSNIDVTSGTLARCSRGVESRNGSMVCAKSADLSASKERGVSAIDGGFVDAQLANCSNSVSRGITARAGARVNAVGANCTGAGNWSVEVLQGSTVAFATGTGAIFNVTINTLTANGTIYQ